MDRDNPGRRNPVGIEHNGCAKNEMRPLASARGRDFGRIQFRAASCKSPLRACLKNSGAGLRPAMNGVSPAKIQARGAQKAGGTPAPLHCPNTLVENPSFVAADMSRLKFFRKTKAVQSRLTSAATFLTSC